jgi:signal transduction histidine kinase
MTLFVRDHGMGFDEARSAELFKPFTRLHGQVVEGHGVGLSIVSRAVDRLGGRVWARAKPGEGACFYFTLPKLV